ncbi:MAG: hypothetical protein ABI925_02270 [Verrucomicrobiota bacterium]
MDQRSKAEEDLRVIRVLMERATVYRAISAPTAIVAGSLSILAAGAIYWNNEGTPVFGRAIRGREFVMVWLAVLIMAAAANTFFIWREARKNGRPFISSGMKLALRAITPCLLIPMAFTGWFYSTGYLGAAELDLVVVWVVFYGLALLSTTLFAPHSLAILGWAFLLSGLALPALTNLIEYFSIDLPLVTMGVTFGAYHLIYAVCSWPWKRAGKAVQMPLE